MTRMEDVKKHINQNLKGSEKIIVVGAQGRISSSPGDKKGENNPQMNVSFGYLVINVMNRKINYIHKGSKFIKIEFLLSSLKNR